MVRAHELRAAREEAWEEFAVDKPIQCADQMPLASALTGHIGPKLQKSLRRERLGANVIAGRRQSAVGRPGWAVPVAAVEAR